MKNKLKTFSLRRKINGLVLEAMFPNDPRRVGQVFLNGRCQFVWLSEHVGRKIFLRRFERNETYFIQKHLKQGDVCLDVGANVGYFSHLFAQRVGNSGRVIAIEPIKRNIALINLASLVNQTETIITVVHAAVSDINGEVFIAAEKDSSYANVLSGNNHNGTPVLGRTLDSIIKDSNLKKIDFMKMDVEGFEYRAFLGMKDILSNLEIRPRTMMIELFSDHLSRYGNSIEEVCSYLARFGYKAMVLDKNRNLIPFKTNHYDKIYNVFFLT